MNKRVDIRPIENHGIQIQSELAAVLMEKDERRRPRRDAPAADQYLNSHHSLPAVPRRGPEAGNSRKNKDL